MLTTTPLNLLIESLVGRSVTHTNSHGREVTLQVENITFESRDVDLEPATQSNDWWPASSHSEWMDLHFVDGSKIRISMNSKLRIS